MTKLRILVADDHALVRQGIKLLINSQPDMCVVAEAGDGETAWREAQSLQPDVVVMMDVSMPRLNGAQATERLTASCKNVKVLALSAHQDEVHVRQLLMSGASGYVLKKAVADELATAIRTVARGGVHLDPQIAGKVVNAYVKPVEARGGEASLSAREQEVLLCIAWGYSNKEIASQLHLSVKTVEGHKTRIMQKLDFKTRSDIVRYALQRGWLHDS